MRSIKAQRIKWLGHIQRMDRARPTGKLLDWRPVGTRPVGRPRQRWQEDVMEDLKKLKVKNGRQLRIEELAETWLTRRRPTKGRSAKRWCFWQSARKFSRNSVVVYFGRCNIIRRCLYDLTSIYRGADKSLARPDWKNNWKVAIFRPEVIAATETWLDGQLSDFFLSGLQKLEFGHCIFYSFLVRLRTYQHPGSARIYKINFFSELFCLLSGMLLAQWYVRRQITACSCGKSAHVAWLCLSVNSVHDCRHKASLKPV